MVADMDRILLEMKDDFLQDCREKFDQIEDLLTKLSNPTDDYDSQFVELQRVIHSIKGNAGSFGFASISHLAHSMEDYISSASESGEIQMSQLGAFVSPMADIVEGGENLSEDETLTIIQTLPSHAQIAETGNADLPRALVHIPEKVWQKIMVQEMTQRGYRVSLADRAVEAIDMAVMMKPQLMVTSLELDRMTGLELASVLSVIKHTQATKVLILSTKSQKDLDRLVQPANVSFLSKGPGYRDGLSEWLSEIGAAKSS